MSPATLERPPAVDPRIEARRLAVDAGRRRRRWRAVLAVAAVVALGAALWGLSRSPVADVDHVEVRGVQHASVEEVVAATGIAAGDPLLDLDPGALASSVEALPWVAQAQVSRHWRDGRVVVEVLERTPVAVVDHPTAWALVDAGGHVLALAPRPEGDAGAPEAVLPAAAGLPRVQGVEPVPAGAALATEQAGPALEVAAALTPGVAEALGAVRVVEGRPELVLADGGTVRLCDTSDLDVKLRTLATALAEIDLTGLATIDVCLADTAVLTREGS